MLAAVAWTLIIAIECATTSCTSRAIPHALGVDAPAGFLLLGLLGPRHAVRFRSQPLAARRHVRADGACCEQLQPHRGIRASEPAERPEQPLGHEDSHRPGEPSGNCDAPCAGQRDPVHADNDRNERGTVDLAERRPPDRAGHGEPEHLDRTAVAPWATGSTASSR